MIQTAIIMAAYNGEAYIREQIDSVMNNTYRDFVLYVYDDSSKDKTWEILQECAKEFGDRIVIRKNVPNKGVKLNFLDAVKENEAD